MKAAIMLLGVHGTPAASTVLGLTSSGFQGSTAPLAAAVVSAVPTSSSLASAAGSHASTAAGITAGGRSQAALSKQHHHRLRLAAPSCASLSSIETWQAGRQGPALRSSSIARRKQRAAAAAGGGELGGGKVASRAMQRQGGVRRVQDDALLDDVAEAVLGAAESIALEAGDFILSRVGRFSEVKSKSERSDLVTEVDCESERMILKRIAAAFPLHRTLGEESAAGEWEQQLELAAEREEEWTWIVDPLDGTLNFVGGIPMCAVSIGVARGPWLEVGVVYNPFQRELFSARRGEGAFLNGRRLSVLPEDEDLEDAAVAVGFPSDPYQRSRMSHAIASVSPHARTMRAFGSAALHMSYVAAGRLGCFFEFDLKPWDIAGARVIIEEAGGLVETMEGGPLPLAGGSVLASNGSSKIHGRVLSLIDKSTKE